MYIYVKVLNEGEKVWTKSGSNYAFRGEKRKKILELSHLFFFLFFSSWRLAATIDLVDFKKEFFS